MIDFLNSLHIWTPEQTAAFEAVCRTIYEQVWLPLHFPTWDVWKDALQVAALDSRQAASSVFTFLFLTLRPLVLLLYMTMEYVIRLIWKYVIVQGISQQGVHYLVAATKALYRHQRSLTPEQLAMEVSMIAGAILLYRIRQFLQRQTYIQRSTAFVRKQAKRVVDSYRQSRKSLRQLYDRLVQKIATTSLLAAVMTPHLVLAFSAVTSKFLFPRLVTWLACETAFLNVLKGWYPLIATISFLHEKKLYSLEKSKSRKEAVPPPVKRSKRESNFQTPQSKRKATPRTPTSFFPRTTPASEHIRRRLGLSPTPVSNSDSLKERQKFWLDFWIVHSGFQACKRMLFILPIVGSFLSRFPIWNQMFNQIELFFYLWIFAVPYLLPNLGNAPEGRPLVLLSPLVRKTARTVYRGMNFFTDAWWEAYPLRLSTAFLDLAVLSRLLSRGLADSLIDLVRHGQSLLIPMASLLMPSFISCYGLLFVQYCMPLQKFQGRRELLSNAESVLRYWVIHCMLTGTVASLSSLLWWIPFSTAVVFCLFLILTIQESLVKRLFGILTEDLEAFGLLPPTEPENQMRSVDQTWSARAVQMLLDRMPKASADNDDDNNNNNASPRRDRDETPLLDSQSVQQDEATTDLAEADDAIDAAAPARGRARDDSMSSSDDEYVPENDNNLKQNDDKENAGSLASPSNTKVRRSTRSRRVITS